jgi:hypothetical protein
MTPGCLRSADVSDGAARHVALAVAYISFRVLTLAGSIYLAMKIAFFDYHALGNSAATACAALMIVGSLVALWVESVISYVLTAARTTDVGDAQSLVRLPSRHERMSTLVVSEHANMHCVFARACAARGVLRQSRGGHRW